MSIESMPDISAINREKQVNRITFWNSRFGFLNVTNGIRQSKVSYLLGTTGTGKTTLLASIIADSAAESSVLVILSEMTPVDYAGNIYAALPGVNKENIKFVSEKDIPEGLRGDQVKVWNWLKLYIVEAGVRLVFWDNLTSSPLFSLSFGPKGQEWAVHRIREMSENMQIAFFVVMHTAKGVTDNMGRFIEGEDVKGTHHSFISADFFYIFQRFSIGKTFYPFIRIVKHRGTNPEHKVHLLYFANGSYLKDTPSSFEEMNEVFLKRNVLGRAK